MGTRVGEADNPGPRAEECIVETFNGSCNATCLDRACRTKATILFVQEHKCVDPQATSIASNQ
eukprot:5814211-Heterocapsa_arctica.AAC.1